MDKSPPQYEKAWENLRHRARFGTWTLTLLFIAMMLVGALRLTIALFPVTNAQLQPSIRMLDAICIGGCCCYIVALSYISAFRCPCCKHLFFQPFMSGIHDFVKDSRYCCPHCGLKNGTVLTSSAEQSDRKCNTKGTMARHNAGVSKKEEILINTVAALTFGFLVSACLVMYWAEPYPIVWRYSMLMNAPGSLVLVSFILCIGVVAPLRKWVRKRSGVPWHLGHSFGVYFMLGVPVMLGFTQLGILINGALDGTKSQVFRTVVVSKRVSKSTKGGTHWHLNVRDWLNPDKSVQFTVSHSQYEATQIGSPMKVVTKSGFLGYEWFVRS